MSFNPHRDGHIIWNYWHLQMANAVTEEKRRYAVAWINSQKIVFPCENCRIHLIDNLEKLPAEPYMKSNVSLFYHSWKLHDMVNEQLGKPLENRLTYPQAFEKYFGRPPETLDEATKKQPQPTSQSLEQNADSNVNQSAPPSQPSDSRMETGVQRRVQDESQRFMARGGHPQNVHSHAAHFDQPMPCATCGKQHVQNGPKIDYDQFRQSRRKVYTAKN